MSKAFPRKQLVYEGCQVYSKEGKLMFHTTEKKLKWYLKRNLAKRIDSKSIQLLFETEGDGNDPELLKIKRLNKCCTCGTEKLEDLTKHHVVPSNYLKFFPIEQKNHQSILVVPMCRSCHDEYEEKALVLKKRLNKNEQQGPTISKIEQKYYKIKSLKRQLNNSHNKRVKKIIENKIELSEIDFLLEFDILFEDYKPIEKDVKNCLFGEKIVKQLGIKKVTEIWIKHFVKKANPSYLDPNHIKYWEDNFLN